MLQAKSEKRKSHISWPIVRLIWFREVRDQLRDRRTLFMIGILPILLYPLLGLAVLQYALSSEEDPSRIGIEGLEHLPRLTPASAEPSPIAPVAWLALTPTGPPGPGAGAERFVAPVALALAAQRNQDYPPLVIADGETSWRFPGSYFEQPNESRWLQVKQLGSREGKALLDTGGIDLLLIVPPNFRNSLEKGRHSLVEIEAREGDRRSQLAGTRMDQVLKQWKRRLKEVRLARQGLPVDYDDPVEVRRPEKSQSTLHQANQNLEELLIRIFPFMIVMWSMAGAMYPAVDICAGEKERGTMETLLLCPAGRLEIAWGKFLTIWMFSAAASVWNLASMSGTTWMLTHSLPRPVPGPAAFLCCALCVLPLSALFSAVCLAIGVYARSTKEGQYYLMPLFLATLPLVFITLAPDVTLNAVTAVVPVTGLALLLQRVLTASAPEQVPWLYFAPVLAAVGLYSWLALLWAGKLFQREEVLFRVP